MEQWINSITNLVTEAGGKIILAILVWIIGTQIIKKILGVLQKSNSLEKIDQTVQSFTFSAVKILLYVILAIAVISILGVPMASVIAVLASCGMAIGLSLQGALSNFAGGIMILIFRPFEKGDFIEAGGSMGVVQETNMFYTVLLTIDNKRVTIPNGTLMNATVIDYSSEENRRVDLVFTCAKSEKPSAISNILLEAASHTDKVLLTPEPFARLSGGTNEAMEFTVRAWCKSDDYWDVFFDLNQNIVEALQAAGVKQPSAKVSIDKD